ncbi:MAG TPA: hypothetical protein DEH78_22410 [Solibacterales bacterium]|nr:hypothetical protein [Bryobacterales bacterium]
MGTTLVVGATGQTGRAAVKNLLSHGAAVRALVRSPESAALFEGRGAEAVLGDLTDGPSLAAACVGVETIVATANAAIPSRRGDRFANVDRDGYLRLIAAAVQAGVRRFVYLSVMVLERQDLSPLFRSKRAVEQALMAAPLEPIVFRADLFMDTSFAMMGSEIPLRGADGATVLRPFGFANRYFESIKDSIERKGVALIPGDGAAGHSFVCVDDVASFLAAAALGGPAGTYDIGGPQVLSFLDVVKVWERVLGKSLRAKHTPAAVLRGMAALLRPFNEAGANLMAMNYIGAKTGTRGDERAASRFGVRLTTADEFLRARITCGAALPTLPPRAPSG